MALMLILAVAALLPAGVARAEMADAGESGEERVDEEGRAPERMPLRRGGEVPPWERVDAPSGEELRAAGWTFIDEDARPGTAVAGLTAGTAGLVVHGLGHWMIGDPDTALLLFLGQGVSIAVFATGIAMRRIAPRSTGLAGASDALAVGAGGLFAATWAGDVVGSFRGTGSPAAFPAFTPDGASLELAFSRLFAQGMHVRDHGVIAVPLRWSRLRIHPELHADTRFDYRRAQLAIGWRIPLDRLSSLELRALGDDEWQRASSAGRTRLGGESVMRLDAGTVVSHLTGLVWELRVGVMADALALESVQGGRRMTADLLRITVPSETALELAVNPVVHLSAGYRHRDDLLVGTWGDQLGVFWGRLGIVPRNRIGAEVLLEQGAFFRAQLGLRWVFAEAAAAP
ncbi:MAG: hypothetical protein EA398_17250 [Deltaproteobacteria bacterium]|nr:MAG: hypothetical protein EA398_17250 [Deltaproteobacteria bacterium]